MRITVISHARVANRVPEARRVCNCIRICMPNDEASTCDALTGTATRRYVLAGDVRSSTQTAAGSYASRSIRFTLSICETISCEYKSSVTVCKNRFLSLQLLIFIHPEVLCWKSFLIIYNVSYCVLTCYKLDQRTCGTFTKRQNVRMGPLTTRVTIRYKKCRVL